MYFPELPAVEFFERSDFPWLESLEGAADQIRSEFLQVLMTDQDGLQPYIDFPLSMPLDQWRDLNRSTTENPSSTSSVPTGRRLQSTWTISSSKPSTP